MTGFPLAEQAAREWGEGFVADVSQLLAALGYQLRQVDDWLLSFAVQKVTQSIKSECNAATAPPALYSVAIDMTTGHFLQALKGSGQLAGYNFEAAVKQIAEGDTSVTYAIDAGSLTPEQRFDALIAQLIERGKSEIVSHRRLRW